MSISRWAEVTEIGPRVRNLILALALIGAGLVVFDLMTGAEWATFVGGLVKGLVG